MSPTSILVLGATVRKYNDIRLTRIYRNPHLALLPYGTPFKESLIIYSYVHAYLKQQEKNLADIGYFGYF